MDMFKEVFGMPSTYGAIDVMQINVQKLKAHVFATNYYSFKSKGYNIQMQVIMDHWKRFWNVYVGIPSSIKNAWVLCYLLIPQSPKEICLFWPWTRKYKNLHSKGQKLSHVAMVDGVPQASKGMPHCFQNFVQLVIVLQ